MASVACSVLRTRCCFCPCCEQEKILSFSLQFVSSQTGNSALCHQTLQWHKQGSSQLDLKCLRYWYWEAYQHWVTCRKSRHCFLSGCCSPCLLDTVCTGCWMALITNCKLLTHQDNLTVSGFRLMCLKLTQQNVTTTSLKTDNNEMQHLSSRLPS